MQKKKKKNALAELDLWFVTGALQATKMLPPLNSLHQMFSFHLN